MKSKPVILIILDGWGIAPQTPGNALSQAKLPTIEHIEKFYPACLVQASSISVGLLWGEPGDCETGHLNLGAGRVIFQYLPRIIRSIQDESFFDNSAFLEAINHAKKYNSCLHLMGIISSSRTQSYIDHLYALMELVKEKAVEKVFLHIFTDGKEAPSQEALKLIQNLQQRLQKFPAIKIATVMGRDFAMDCNEDWPQTQKAYQCLTQARGKIIENPIDYLKKSYSQGIGDNCMEPATIKVKSQSASWRTKVKSQIKDGDAVIFFNFREDSAKQLTRTFVDPNFNKFERKFLKNLCFVSMTQYDKNLPTKIAFPPFKIENTLAETLFKKGKKQLRIAESKKYAPITHFFNGFKEEPFPDEERIIIPSLQIPHFDLHPEMGALEITNELIKNLWLKKYDFMVINFANPDIIGRTGNLRAAVKAGEVIDNCLARILKEILDIDGTLIITSDHGNVEEMLDPVTGRILTKRTSNPVPLYLINWKFKQEKSPREIQGLYKEEPKGVLADIAPTILELMALPQPKEMTGKSLLPYLKADYKF